MSYYNLTVGEGLNRLFDYVFHHEEMCVVEDRCELWANSVLDMDDFFYTFDVLYDFAVETSDRFHSMVIEVLDNELNTEAVNE